MGIFLSKLASVFTGWFETFFVDFLTSLFASLTGLFG